MKKEAKVIVFSGGCYSGKTTTIDSVAAILNAQGHSIILLNELMRHKPIISIDDIRSNPSEYLKLQDDIVRVKIMRELEVFELHENAIVLIDRAITDSLFYALYYVDKHNMSIQDLKLYNNLLLDIRSHAKFAFRHIYDFVAFFRPLDKVNDAGKFRPANINIMKNIESGTIEMLNNAYLSSMSGRYERIDLNDEYYFDTATRIAKWYTDSLKTL